MFDQETDQWFRQKSAELILEFIGIYVDCMFKNFEQEFVIKEDPKIRITAKLSRIVSFEFNYIDQNTGQILIKNKAKLDTKGKKFESLISCGIFGDYNHFEQSLQKKINIIENGSITFKVLLNTIIIKIVVEDKRIKKNAYGAASARELTIIIIFKNSNLNDNNTPPFGFQQRERAQAPYTQGYGFGNNPGMMPKPFFGGFRPGFI